MNRAARLVCHSVGLLALLFLTACFVPSVNPLYEDGDTYYDDSLEGTWKAYDGTSSMTLARNSAGNCYLVTYEEKAERSRFDGCLTRVGNAAFLDLTAGEAPCAEAAASHLVPVHSFWRFESSMDTSSLQPLDANWVESRASRKQLGLANVKLRDQFVLTASTKALRKFFKRYAESDEPFAGKSIFHRQK
jgi:hypothetical protein